MNTNLRLPDGNGLEIADRAADHGARTSILSGYVLQLPPDAADRHEVLMKPMRLGEFRRPFIRLSGRQMTGSAGGGISAKGSRKRASASLACSS